jgi:acyl carrier protein
MPSRSEVEEFVKTYLGPRLQRAGVKELRDDLSLTSTGVIDSFGLLELVSATEEKFSVQVNVDSIDIDELTTFGGFVGVFAKSP